MKDEVVSGQLFLVSGWVHWSIGQLGGRRQENDDDDSLDKWYRRYAVVVLTPEQLATEHEVDADFQRYVGSAGNRRPVEEHHLFYDKHLQYCRSRSYNENEVIAWLEL